MGACVEPCREWVVVVDVRAPGPEGDLLLATKTTVPRLREGRVARPRLLERLRAATVREFVLVCAPAGFGKSTLLADWVQVDRRPVAWLSLDEGDNDPVRFWRHIAAAMDRARPGVAERASLLVGDPTSSSFMPAVTALVNDLAESAEDVVLVVDDYHLIHAQHVHRSVEFLLEHLPGSLRLVVASRSDPPLPLARLRARGQSAELRAADLRFTLAEAAQLMAASTGLDLPEDVVGALGERTEGWVAGLQLAALSLQGRRDVEGFVAEFSGSHRYVLDYLTEEVLDRQPPDIRTFLLETSVLDRLSGALCDAVLERRDSQLLLESVERANLFLLPLDDERRWWRYHHLFADLLRSRLAREDPTRAAALHHAAAGWYERQGLPTTPSDTHSPRVTRSGRPRSSRPSWNASSGAATKARPWTGGSPPCPPRSSAVMPGSSWARRSSRCWAAGWTTSSRCWPWSNTGFPRRTVGRTTRRSAGGPAS